MSEYGERIASLESSRGTHHSWISSVERSTKERADKLEVRIHEMEAVMNKAKGGWAILAGICAGSGIIGGFIARFFNS